MYNSLKRAAALLIISLFMCACTSSGVTQIKFEDRESDTDSVSIKLRIPVFYGMENKEFCNSLNDMYEAKIRSYTDEFAAGTNISPKNELTIQEDIKYNKNNFVSIVSEIYSYHGGAHGSTVRSAENIDIDRCAVIELGDLFKDGCGYETLINRRMRDMAENNREEYGTLWEQPVLTDSQKKDFYIENGKLVIYYHPYALSYYARGFVEFPIKLSELDFCLKDEYKRLIE